MADSIIKKYILARVSGSASAALAAASKVAAAASAAAAAVSQAAAAASATAAANSATAAAASASGAAGSATAAAGSATAAASSASSASTSATNAASSASAASTSATNASASATNAASSASAASTSATNAANSYDSFDDRYLGAKSSDPSVDNDGNALLTGALYWNTTAPEMRVWNGSAWVNVPFTATGVLLTANNLSELAASPSTARSNLGLGTAATLNVPASGNASPSEVVKGNDTRIANAATTGKAIAMAIVFGG